MAWVGRVVHAGMGKAQCEGVGGAPEWWGVGKAPGGVGGAPEWCLQHRDDSSYISIGNDARARTGALMEPSIDRE
jgi:hypothetical protein